VFIVIDGGSSLRSTHPTEKAIYWQFRRRLVAHHAGDRTERHAELGVGGFVDLNGHFVGFPTHIVTTP